jgi:hypothetical protein
MTHNSPLGVSSCSKLLNFQSEMEQKTFVKLFNPQLKIGLVSWCEAWLFETEYPEKLYTEVYKGRLVFRQRSSSKRTSYCNLKKGLIRKQILIKEKSLYF